MSALALFSSIASLTASPVTLLSMIPLVAIGLNYYRYTNVDPESHPIDAPEVSKKKLSSNFLHNKFAAYTMYSCRCYISFLMHILLFNFINPQHIHVLNYFYS